MEEDRTWATEDASPDEQAARPDRNYEWQANRALGRARKILSSNGGQPDPMVDLLLASANVLATLELADAIRSSKRS